MLPPTLLPSPSLVRGTGNWQHRHSATRGRGRKCPCDGHLLGERGTDGNSGNMATRGVGNTPWQHSWQHTRQTSSPPAGQVARAATAHLPGSRHGAASRGRFCAAEAAPPGDPGAPWPCSCEQNAEDYIAPSINRRDRLVLARRRPTVVPLSERVQSAGVEHPISETELRLAVSVAYRGLPLKSGPLAGESVSTAKACVPHSVPEHL